MKLLNIINKQKIKKLVTSKGVSFGILAIILVGIFVPSYVFAEVISATDATDCANKGGSWAPNGSGLGGGICTKNNTTDPNDKKLITNQEIAKECQLKNLPVAYYSDGTAYCKVDAPQNTGTEASKVAANFIFSAIAKGVGYTLMTLSSLILSLVGTGFDWIVKYTIVDMGSNVGDPNGLGGGIAQAWATLRDVANLCFIFVLLYTAFKAMFELNIGSIGKPITNIIIVALLINFSLFFSKVVIDASNVVALGFYKSITSSNVITVGGSAAATQTQERSISSGYMRLLGIQSLFSSDILNKRLDAIDIFITGIMASVFMLITSVIFLITTAMFAARFIILIFVMILSPLALIAFIIPGQNSNFEKWKNMLIDQSIFPAIYFALTWVVFKVASSQNFLGVGASAVKPEYSNIVYDSPISSASLIINYVLIIGFSIAALVIAKQIASKTAGFSAITGAIGSGVLGGTALVGRNTIGRTSKLISESSGLRNAAASNKWYSGAARAGLWTANQGSKGSFDVRASDTIKKVPGLGKEMDILGKAGGKGGFSKAIEKKAEEKVAYAKSVYGQTAAETEKAKVLEKEYGRQKVLDENRIKTEREKVANEKEEIHNRNIAGRNKYFNDSGVTGDKRVVDAEADFEFKKDEYEKAKKSGTKNKEELEELKKVLDESKDKIEKTKEAVANEVFRGNTDYINSREATKSSKEELNKAKEKLRMNKENKFDDNEYSDEVKELKTKWEAKKDAGKKRIQEFANRVEKGAPVSTVVGGVVGGAVGGVFGASVGAGIGNWAGGKLPKWLNWKGNVEAGRKLRALADGNEKADKKKLAKQIQKELGVEDDEESGGEGKKKDDGGGDKDKKDKS